MALVLYLKKLLYTSYLLGFLIHFLGSVIRVFSSFIILGCGDGFTVLLSIRIQLFSVTCVLALGMNIPSRSFFFFLG